MNKLYLISCGTGEGNITLRALNAIAECGLILGAERLIRQYAPDSKHIPSPADAQTNADIINESNEKAIGILLSGDAGLYSLATTVRPLINNRETITIPGVSVAQSAAAILNTPWQDCDFISLHGRTASVNGIDTSRNHIILTQKGIRLEDHLEAGLLDIYDIWIMRNLYTEEQSVKVWDGRPFECEDMTVIALMKKLFIDI